MLFIMRSRRWIKKLVIGLLWLALWHITYKLVDRALYVPSITSVMKALLGLIIDVRFWQIIAASVYRVLAGLFLSLVFGVSIGVLCGLNGLLFDFINPFVKAIRATPVISFIIIALIWFKSTNVPIFISFLMCFPIIWTNVVSGIRNIDVKLIEMAKVYQLKRSLIIRKIYLPHIKPFFTAGVIMALGLGWKVSVAAEVLSHPQYAIGSNLHSAKAYLDTPLLFAWTIVVILLSFIFESFFALWAKESRKTL
ncbi:ABC transporter permease [Petrocella sp. FN5]|uniref:ABC transporter permease n=1 Tax=Petrocella sp. FN5 TaxID=3032002 RepID=UPI0023D9C684|nr:ABC transporter permease subunit [Petrocella sp. FN5]MDF1617206.1 ABC transporter permease subunit [Petrocella sp. FN5]